MRRTTRLLAVVMGALLTSTAVVTAAAASPRPAEPIFDRSPAWQLLPSPTEQQSLVQMVRSEGVGAPSNGGKTAGDWQAAGITGEGMRVAIIDMAFADAHQQRGDELPSTFQLIDRCGGDVEGEQLDSYVDKYRGTAMAEIVHDMASDADLTLVCIDQLADVEASIPALVASSVDIVLVPFSSLIEGRGDGSALPGTLAAAIKKGRIAGQNWVVPAGNLLNRTENLRVVDADGDDLLEFYNNPVDRRSGPDGNEFGSFTLPAGSSVSLFAKWDRWAPHPPGEAQFCVWGTYQGLRSYLGCSPLSSGRPVAGVFIQNGLSDKATYQFVLAADGIPKNTRLQLIWADPVEGPQPRRSPTPSVSTPGDSPYAFTVGMNCIVGNEFSGEGPTIDGRYKPDILAASDVSTFSFGARKNCSEKATGGGTSFSSAHVAGGLALIGERFPDHDAGQRERELLRRTETADEAPWTNLYALDMRFGDPTTPALIDDGPRPFDTLDDPIRVLDTRISPGTPLARGDEHYLYLYDVLPDDAVAVAINVVAVGQNAGGHLTLAPLGTTPPNVSNVNYGRSQTIANHATVLLGDNQGIHIGNHYGETHVVVDLVGVYRAGATDWFEPLAVPERAVDSRRGTTYNARNTPLLEEEVFSVDVTGVGLSIPDDATAVAVNVTAVNATGRAHLSLTPGGVSPQVSSVNYPRGVAATPNLVIVGLDENGRFDVTNAPRTNVHVVLDIIGYWSPTATNGYVSLAPHRFIDTRNILVDSHTDRAPKHGTVGSINIPFEGMYGVDSDAAAVLLNVTVTQPAGNGYVTVHAFDEAKPVSSNLNYQRGQTVPNSVISATEGGVRFYSLNATHLVGDLQGYFVPRVPPAAD